MHSNVFSKPPCYLPDIHGKKLQHSDIVLLGNDISFSLSAEVSHCTCAGEPARSVGWRDPGFIHTAFLTDLWPNKE